MPVLIVSRLYTGLWRALMVLEDPTDGRDVIMHTEQPETYEEIERYLWKVGAMGLTVEGMRVKRALLVPVSE